MKNRLLSGASTLFAITLFFLITVVNLANQLNPNIVKKSNIMLLSVIQSAWSRGILVAILVVFVTISLKSYIVKAIARPEKELLQEPV